MAKTKNQSKRAVLAITEDMNIYNAQAHKERILEAFDEAEEVEFDLSKVAEIDTAGFQLLVMAKREAVRTGKTMSIERHSPAVREVIEFFHMAAYFGDPVVISAREGK